MAKCVKCNKRLSKSDEEKVKNNQEKLCSKCLKIK